MGDGDEPYEVICAWCKVQVSDGRQPVSHGICSDCLQDLLFAISASQASSEGEGDGGPPGDAPGDSNTD